MAARGLLALRLLQPLCSAPFSSATSTTAARDYYKILQIRPNASPEEVKQAFHALSKKYHPDVAGSDPQSHTKFIEISEAFSVLGKEQSRREYDLQRRLNAFSANADGYKMTYPKVDLSIDPQVLKSYDMEMHRRWSSRLDEWARDQGEYELERGIHMTPVNAELSVSYLSMEESRHFTYMLAGFTAFLAAITYLYVQVKTGKRTATAGG
ncbi:hypothetical protein AAHC03_013770 [Spirometra sp. Aus1]